MPLRSPLRGGRVVQVMARTMVLRARSNCWHNVVLPPPEGAEIRSRSGAEGFCDFGPWTLDFGLFDILHLFPEPFEFSLQGDHFARNDGVVGFGADGIDLAVH